MPDQNTWQLYNKGTISASSALLIIILCMAIMVIDSSTSWLSPVRKAISFVIYPTQKIAIWPKNIIGKVYQWSEALDIVQDSVRDAQHRSIELTKAQTQLRQLESENQQLRRLLDLRQYMPTSSIAVEILYTPINQLHETLVFNKGERDGIKPGMPVIGEGGLVGQIQRVSPKTSEVSLITDDNMMVPAILLRNGLRVIVYGGNKGNNLEMRYLTPGSDVKVGDEVLTSGIGNVYPSGLAIGKVIKIIPSSAQGFAVAIVEPYARPSENKHFLVLQTVNPLEEPYDPEDYSDNENTFNKSYVREGLNEKVR